MSFGMDENVCIANYSFSHNLNNFKSVKTGQVRFIEYIGTITNLR